MTPRGESILLIDDDLAILRGTTQLMEQEGLPSCLVAANGKKGLELSANPEVAVVLLDLGLPDLPGEEVLSELRSQRPEVPVVIVTAQADLELAVRCMGAGAYDYVVKGTDPTRLLTSVRRALQSRRQQREIEALREGMLSAQIRHPEAFEAIVTKNEAMKTLFRFVEAVAPTEEPILLLGETGTGKELFAQAAHKASGRTGEFVATNLGGLDDAMVSDTLFGHTKGSYTGANEARKGLIVAAAEGTLFLDEIGDLSQASQTKLLRLLENGEYFPLGSDTPRRSQARIIAATNRDLEQMTADGTFRRDLLFRLATYRIDIPPLRRRAEDIPLIAEQLLKRIAQGSEHPKLTPAASAVLQNLPFPGNIRELRGLLLRAKVAAEGSEIDAVHLASFVSVPPAADKPEANLPTIRDAVNQLIDEALRRTGGQQNRAAALLGITPQALSRRLKHRDEDSLG